MEHLTEKKVVQLFKETFAPLLKAKTIDVQAVIQQFANFYQENRVAGASLKDDGDMLLLEWGSCEPLRLNKVTDLRTLDDDEVQFEEKSYRWLGLTRQIFTGADDEEADFDEQAFTLYIAFFFGPAKEDEPSGELWISKPAEISKNLKKLLKDKYVAQLLKSKLTRLNICIDAAG